MNTKESDKLWDRDGAVELLRVLLVFGICLLHSFGQSAVKCRMGVCVYVFAALCRRARVEDRLSATCLWMIAFGCLVISSIGFGFYLSPFAVGLAMSVFFLFKRVTIRSSCGLNVLSLAGPSLFSVYLLHAHRPLFSLLPRFQEWLIGFGCPVWSTYLVIAGMVFLCGVIIDLPRRVVVGVLEGPINMLLGVADRAIAASAERMVRLVAD